MSQLIKIWSRLCYAKAINLVWVGVFLLHSLVLQAKSGEENFNSLCMTCHSLTDKVLVGPGLAGVKDRASEEWLIKWIKDPAALLSANDKYATEIFNKFNKVPMPGFPQLSDDEIKELLAFIDSKSVAPAAGAPAETASASSSSSSVSSSTDSVLKEDPFFSKFGFLIFIGIAVVGFLLYRYKRKTKELINHLGHHEPAHQIPNYAFLLMSYLGIAGVLIFLVVYMLENNLGKINDMMFIALPYVAFAIFIIGSIYRYTKRGYQFTSLSSQFLEGKKLFWASQPFHWGIFIIFFGHLIAFLFPKAVLAWNGEPVRLLILEYSSFAFGIAALFGLAMLIKRRLNNKSLLVVANKMDMLVYTVLAVQILSGLGVAFFVRWGSSWFSSVLTPYLRSIFSFNPDITAVAETPWLVQVHIISAFVIIGIIPFTRFVHFLVYPLDYLWRRTQVVIWNWNPKNIRASVKWNFGKKTRNH